VNLVVGSSAVLCGSIDEGSYRPGLFSICFARVDVVVVVVDGAAFDGISKEPMAVPATAPTTRPPTVPAMKVLLVTPSLRGFSSVEDDTLIPLPEQNLKT